MIKYSIIENAAAMCDGIEYKAYGIRADLIVRGERILVDMIDDISSNRDLVLEFVERCNKISARPFFISDYVDELIH